MKKENNRSCDWNHLFRSDQHRTESDFHSCVQHACGICNINWIHIFIIFTIIIILKRLGYKDIFDRKLLFGTLSFCF